MSFVPDVVTPVYSLTKTRENFVHLRDLRFPADRQRIAHLSLAEMQVWYAAQDPQELITVDSNTKKPDAVGSEESDFSRRSEFSRFWFWHYILPLRLKRALYWFKFW